MIISIDARELVPKFTMSELEQLIPLMEARLKFLNSIVLNERSYCVAKWDNRVHVCKYLREKYNLSLRDSYDVAGIILKE